MEQLVTQCIDTRLRCEKRLATAPYLVKLATRAQEPRDGSTNAVYIKKKKGGTLCDRPSLDQLWGLLVVLDRDDG